MYLKKEEKEEEKEEEELIVIAIRAHPNFSLRIYLFGVNKLLYNNNNN